MCCGALLVTPIGACINVLGPAVAGEDVDCAAKGILRPPKSHAVSARVKLRFTWWRRVTTSACLRGRRHSFRGMDLGPSTPELTSSTVVEMSRTVFAILGIVVPVSGTMPGASSPFPARLRGFTALRSVKLRVYSADFIWPSRGIVSGLSPESPIVVSPDIRG